MLENCTNQIKNLLQNSKKSKYALFKLILKTCKI